MTYTLKSNTPYEVNDFIRYIDFTKLQHAGYIVKLYNIRYNYDDVVVASNMYSKEGAREVWNNWVNNGYFRVK